MLGAADFNLNMKVALIAQTLDAAAAAVAQQPGTLQHVAGDALQQFQLGLRPGEHGAQRGGDQVPLGPAAARHGYCRAVLERAGVHFQRQRFDRLAQVGRRRGRGKGTRNRFGAAEGGVNFVGKNFFQ